MENDDNTPGLVSNDENILNTSMNYEAINMDHEQECVDAMIKPCLEQSAIKAMKQYAECVKSKGASSGAVVTLKVDHKEVHSHPYGLLGVIYKAVESCGILVVCEHGIITSSGCSKDFCLVKECPLQKSYRTYVMQ